MTWFKFWCDAHSHPKLASLSDAEFRLLTYIWALARRSSDPGRVFVTPTQGVSPVSLARGAGCEHPDDGPQMLAALERVALLSVAPNGVITVNGFDDANRVPPSKTPEGRKIQKAKERSRTRVASVATDVAMPVATESPPGSPALSSQNVQTEGEEEGEEEEEKLASNASRISTESRLPPLVERFRDAVFGAVVVHVAKPDPAKPERVATETAALDAALQAVGLDAAIGIARTKRAELSALGRAPPRSLSYFTPVLRDALAAAPPKRTRRECIGTDERGAYVYREIAAD